MKCKKNGDNGKLVTTSISQSTPGECVDNPASYLVKNGWCFVTLECTPNKIENLSVIQEGLPKPLTAFFVSLENTLGGSYSAMMNNEGTLIFYYTSYTVLSRIDTCFSYPIK